MSLPAYEQFLRNKMAIAQEGGFVVEDHDIHPLLKPHQREAVKWAVRGGRRALLKEGIW